MKPAEREGMALLTALLLVAALAALAVVVLDDVRFSIHRARNAELAAQARWQALGGEALAMAIIARADAASPDRTPVLPQWMGRPRTLPVAGGAVTVAITDGQACFNLNSVVTGYGEHLVGRDQGRLQFLALAASVGVPPERAEALADALTDWIDADQIARPKGAEDPIYQSGSQPYRTGGTLLAEASELRAVRGVDRSSYRALRPYVCAMPTPDPTPINVNTLTPSQAPLLVMLTRGRLTQAAARAIIAARPPEGWRSIEAFRRHPSLAALGGAHDLDQTTVRTRHFNVRVDVELGGARAVRTALVGVDDRGEVRRVIHRWTLDE